MQGWMYDTGRIPMLEGRQRTHYDAFISYRREGGTDQALLLQKALKVRGFNAFVDLSNLDSGHYDKALLKHIAKAPNFIVLLSEHALDRCAAEGDWLRLEIARALATKRNIIPMLVPPFEFPPASQLPEEIRELTQHQGVPYYSKLLEGTVSKLIEMMQLPWWRSRRLRVSFVSVVAMSVIGLSVFFVTRYRREASLQLGQLEQAQQLQQKESH